MSNKFDYESLFHWIVLGGLGGLVRYVAMVIVTPVGGDHPPFSWGRFFAMAMGNCFVSSFFGLMGGLIAFGLSDNPVHHVIVAGVIGYSGTKGFEELLKVVADRFTTPPKR